AERAAVIDNGVGIEDAAVADRAVAAERHARMQRAVVTDNCTGANADEWADVTAFADLRRRVNYRPRVDAGIVARESRMEVLKRFEEGKERVLGLDDRRTAMSEVR